jgi:hypothetical protein
MLPLLAAIAVLPSASASVLWENALPTNGNTGFDAAPLYGTICDANVSTCPGGTNKAYILGDQFTLSGSSNTITSVTVYEVGNVATTEFGTPGDSPITEFNGLDLYVAPDGATSGMGAPVDILTGAALGASATQVCYSGACGAGGMNFESLTNPSNYYAIYAVTFSGLDLVLGPGLYDFAVGANPKAGETFALLTSDPNHSGTSEEDSSTLCGTTGCGYIYYLPDGTGHTPLETYQYAPGSIGGYSNGADANVIINGTSTPEPATFGMLGLGLAGVWAGLRRRARNHRV